MGISPPFLDSGRSTFSFVPHVLIAELESSEGRTCQNFLQHILNLDRAPPENRAVHYVSLVVLS